MGYSDIEFKFESMGENVYIGKNVYFRYPEKSIIGNNVIIDEFCFFSTPVVIGNYIHIAPYCSVIGGEKSRFIMENYSQMTAGCRIACGSDDFLGSGIVGSTIPSPYRAKVITGIVKLKEHAVLGMGCVVHPGVTIGEGSVVGSMSLVIKDLEEWGVYLGIPVKRVKDRDKSIIIDKTFKLEGGMV